jgi:mono/diheme cytochrome c family protein
MALRALRAFALVVVLVTPPVVVIGGAVAADESRQAPVMIPRIPPVDMAAHDRGRAIWARECVDCHGTQARGAEKGPNIIRSRTVNFDRSSPTPGAVLGPYLAAGHPTQSGRPGTGFSQDDVVALANFLRQRVNDTMRSSPLFTVGDILIGDRAAGEAYFNGAGRCASCHNETRNTLKASASTPGIGTRIPAPVDLQQRMLFPRRGRGGSDANAISVTISPAAGAPLSGVLVEQSDFFVTLRLADGTVRAVRRTPETKVTLSDPLQAHIDLLDVLTDQQIHNLVAYLESLK